MDNAAAVRLPAIVDRKGVRTVRAGLPADEVIADAVEVLKALANPVRVRIVHALAHEELCVGDIAQAFRLSMSVVSHQLALLKRLKLVASREVGRQVYYRVIDGFVGDLVHDCLAHVEEKIPTAPRHHHAHRRR
jgi:DNA-binding transcriptional ArsR family regulator